MGEFWVAGSEEFASGSRCCIQRNVSYRMQAVASNSHVRCEHVRRLSYQDCFTDSVTGRHRLELTCMMRLNGGLSIPDRCGAQHPNTRQSDSGNTSWPVFTSLFWLRTATGTRSELRTPGNSWAPLASLHFFSAQADTVSAPRRY